MVVRGHKKLNKRRVAVRTPGGKVVYHFRRKIYRKPHCASCGRPLTGVRNGPRSYMSKLAKSEKRPNRPYGGNLCSKCFRELFTEKAIAEGLALLGR